MMWPAVSGGNDAPGLGIEDPATHRPRCQILGPDPGAPFVEFTRDREVLGRPLVHRADDLDRGLSPAQHVVARRAGEADQVGDDLERKGAGQRIDGLERSLGHQVRDQRIGLGLDLALESPQRPRGEVLGERRAQFGVDRRVGGQGRASERLVDHRVEADRPGREGAGVGQGVADDVVPGEGIDVVGGQMHHRAEIAEFGVRRIGVGQDLVGEEVDVGTRGSAAGHAPIEVTPLT
ncbi:hypothetical protein [Rhodococcus aetherivorans]|uniref:hypothetical protein n=1 Tax=Rhodococcus aetherivorans TaxID=191292 RepID=UPI001F33C6DE|nr:hypothetical protein [Rhodococcus aetherivorans]